MKTALPILIALAVGGLLGWGLCHGMGMPVTPRDGVVAAAVALAATLASLGVLRLAAPPGATQDAVAQGTLVASVVQLFATGLFTVGAWLAAGVHGHRAFLIWMMAFYWSLLTGLVVVLVHRVRAAPPAKAPSRP